MQLLLLLFNNSVYYAIACCLGRRIRYIFVITLFKFSGNLKIIGHSVFPLIWIIVIGGLILQLFALGILQISGFGCSDPTGEI